MTSAQQQFDGAAAAILAEVGANACVHIVDIDTGEAVGREPDRLIVTASVVKLPILLTYALQVAAGTLDPTERVIVGPDMQVIGPTGLSVFCDVVDLSLRDLAGLMMTVSDNTATDVLLSRIGIDSVNDTLDGLGLSGTRIYQNCADLLGSIGADLGLAEPPETVARFPAAELTTLRILDSALSNHSTARESTRLLCAIWRDVAGPAPTCAEVRRILNHQVWGHRVSAGLPEGSQWGGKTGTLPSIRNEIGVAVWPDGREYAIAVFTRADEFSDRRPDIDRAIGRLARAGVDALRG